MSISNIDSQALRDYIEESQWKRIVAQLNMPSEAAPVTSFFGTTSSVSDSGRHFFTGVLDLSDDHYAQKKPPMPLTKRNLGRLAAMGFVVTEDGRWAVWQEGSK